MTDRSGDVTERSDPVLVRPYITTEPENAGPTEEAETWPAPETEGDTAIQPVVPPAVERPAPPRQHSVHWTLRLLAPVVVLIAALGIAGYFVLGGGSRDDAQHGPGTDLPTVNPPAAPTGGAAASARPSSSPSHSASPSAPPSSSSAAPPSGTPSVSSAPSSTLAPPPATARTGRLTSAGGRCLTLGGLLGLDGSPIQTATCIGGTPQEFTLATDGTLRVAGRCATATGDASVRSAGCGAATGSQWRAGPDGELVTPSTGQCLTDPGTNGGTTRVEPCTGAGTQRWTLP